MSMWLALSSTISHCRECGPVVGFLRGSEGEGATEHILCSFCSLSRDNFSKPRTPKQRRHAFSLS